MAERVRRSDAPVTSPVATMTPWGPADRLRERRLRPGPSHSREDRTRNQRERMMAAMVAAAAERGYAGTRVADVLEIAGVSRSSASIVST